MLCRAGGSVDFAQVDRHLQQKPEIRAILVRSLVLPDTVLADVRLGSHFEHLGGQRLGPYTFEALARDHAGPEVRVTLCTSYVFLDGAGQPIPDGADRTRLATDVREWLDAVVIRDAGASGAADCPGKAGF